MSQSQTHCAHYTSFRSQQCHHVAIGADVVFFVAFRVSLFLVEALMLTDA